MANPPTSLLRTSSQWMPGYVPTYSAAGGRATSSMSPYTAWEDTVFQYVVSNLNSGDTMRNGQPPTWDANRYGNWSLYKYSAMAEGGITDSQAANIRDFIRSGGLDQASVDLGWGARPAAGKTEYTETPDAANARLYQENLMAQNARNIYESDRNYALNVRQQNFAEAKWYIANAVNAASGAGGGGGGSRYASGSSYGGYGAADDKSMTDYQAAQIDIARQELAMRKTQMELEMEIARGRLTLDEAKLAADIAYQNNLLSLQTQQFEESKRQFEETLAFQKERAAAEERAARGRTIAELSANPNDWVARDVYIREGWQPVGTWSDVFTGEQMGQGTYDELAALNAQNLPISPQAAMGGVVAQMPGGAEPPAEPSPNQPAQTVSQDVLNSLTKPVPAAARGLAFATSPMFVTGDKTRGTTGAEEVVLNPTRAPFAVLPNSEVRDKIKRAGPDSWDFKGRMP